jgi:hypothetical protein
MDPRDSEPRTRLGRQAREKLDAGRDAPRRGDEPAPRIVPPVAGGSGDDTFLGRWANVDRSGRADQVRDLADQANTRGLSPSEARDMARAAAQGDFRRDVTYRPDHLAGTMLRDPASGQRFALPKNAPLDGFKRAYVESVRYEEIRDDVTPQEFMRSVRTIGDRPSRVALGTDAAGDRILVVIGPADRATAGRGARAHTALTYNVDTGYLEAVESTAEPDEHLRDLRDEGEIREPRTLL